MLLIHFPFGIAQYATRQAIAAALDNRFDTRHFNDIGAQPQYGH